MNCPRFTLIQHGRSALHLSAKPEPRGPVNAVTIQTIFGSRFFTPLCSRSEWHKWLPASLSKRGFQMAKKVGTAGTGGSKAQGTSAGSGSRPGKGKFPIQSSHSGFGGKK